MSKWFNTKFAGELTAQIKNYLLSKNSKYFYTAIIIMSRELQSPIYMLTKYIIKRQEEENVQTGEIFLNIDYYYGLHQEFLNFFLSNPKQVLICDALEQMSSQKNSFLIHICNVLRALSDYDGGRVPNSGPNIDENVFKSILLRDFYNQFTDSDENNEESFKDMLSCNSLPQSLQPEDLLDFQIVLGMQLDNFLERIYDKFQYGENEKIFKTTNWKQIIRNMSISGEYADKLINQFKYAHPGVL